MTRHPCARGRRHVVVLWLCLTALPLLAAATPGPSAHDILAQIAASNDVEATIAQFVAVGRPGVPALIGALADAAVSQPSRNPTSDVRAPIVTALRLMPDPAVSTDLVAALHHADPGVRRFAARALGWRGANAVELAALLNDADARVRAFAAEALRWTHDAGAGPILARALRDPASTVRLRAAETLAALDGAQQCDALGDALADADANVASTAALAVGRAVCTTAIPKLQHVLGDGAVLVRAWALWTLGELGDPTVTPAVAAVLKSSETRLRVAAVLALGSLPGQPSRDALSAALNNRDPEVRFAARYSFERSTTDPGTPPLHTSAPHVQRRLVVIGDSISAEPSYVGEFAGICGPLLVRNFSLHGSTSQNWTPDTKDFRSLFWTASKPPLRAALDDLSVTDFLRPGTLAIVALGTNDIATRATPAEFGLRMTQLLATLRDHGLRAAVPLIPTPVGFTKPYNRILETLWRRLPEVIQGPDLAALAADPRLLENVLHPNRAGQHRIAEAWCAVLRNHFAD